MKIPLETGNSLGKLIAETQLKILLKLKQQIELKLKKCNKMSTKITIYNIKALWTMKHMLYSKKNHLTSTLDNAVITWPLPAQLS